MGGFNSGRRSGYGTVEGTFTLDMAQSMRLRQFTPGGYVKGRITWRNSRTGDAVGSVDYTADTRDPDDAWVSLSYSTTYLGETARQTCRVQLTTTQPHFGGLRWWFVCPLSGRRVRCLHLAGQCKQFASRQRLKLKYQSQRETWSDRRLRAAQAIGRLLNMVPPFPDEPPPKPKWMRWPTYWQLVQKWERASEAHLITSLAASDDLWIAAILKETASRDFDLLAGSGLI